MDSTVAIPIIFWSKCQPTFRISDICVSPNGEKLILSSYGGQLFLWDLKLDKYEVTPKTLLIGHKYSVTCMVVTNEYVISSCEGALMCRWNLEDGYCEKTNKTLFVHRNMQLYNNSNYNNELLFTCGDYSDILIIHSFTLQVMYVLNSQTVPYWISSFFVISSANLKTDVVVGITYTGCIMKWIIDKLKFDSQSESFSNTLSISNVIALKYNSNISKVLVVSDYYWTLFNSELSVTICQVNAAAGERLLGGDFCDINIVVWSNAGKFYIYNNQSGNNELICTIWDNFSKINVFDPAMNIFQTSKNEKFFIMGESFGKVNIWSFNFFEKLSNSLFSFTIKDKWITNSNEIFNRFNKYREITCTIYVLELDKFFLGCFDGAIICVPAEQCIMSFCYHSTVKMPSFESLLEHKGKITCLLYPYEKYSHFQKSHLVSGGSDFSVCLWDVFKLELLHKFCVQSGEILKLILPPKDCSFRVKSSICSVSSDHSVALLNLKDKRCIILTSRHEFPVVTVNWKPLDDFIVIECFDGTVYVWQMETGHLDRVLHGVLAQEVLFTCNNSNLLGTQMWNFYINEAVVKKNSMHRKVFQIQNCFDMKESPFTMNGFLTSEKSESHIFMCNVEYLIGKVHSYLKTENKDLDCAPSWQTYLLTHSLSLNEQKKTYTLLDKIKQETEKYQNQEIESVEDNLILQCQDKKKDDTFYLSDTFLKIIRFFISSIHLWELNPILDEQISNNLGLLKPEIPFAFGIFSKPGIFSLFFPASYTDYLNSSSLVASTCITIITFSNILQSPFKFCSFKQENNIAAKLWWEKLISFYELIFLNSKKNFKIPPPKIQILAKAWQTECLPLRKIARKLLGCHLQSLEQKENCNLLKFWYHYLPHFKILDKMSHDKIDFENYDLKAMSLILFGIVGSDLKFKANNPDCQENYIYQTCASFVYLMLLTKEQKHHFYGLQTMAIDFIGRGYIVWEPFLKIDKVLPVLFEMCDNLPKSNFENTIPTAYIDKSFTALNALKSIAIARTAAFINCLIKEINQAKSQTNTRKFLIENSKAAILSIIIFLLEKTPYIMILYLNDIVSIFVFCIDCSHLKHENLANLIPVIKKFRQLHHSVISQRIAVGLSTGMIALHDLRSGKSHSVSAHKDSVSAVKFSEDGKSLVSYSCYENRVTFWQIFTGIFGLGHIHLKCIKSFQTYQIHDEEIRNHFEVAELTWKDNTSVILSLCDGTETIFHC